MVLSVDEKTSIQALERTQLPLPLRSPATRHTHDYKRWRGVLDLYAALEIATPGNVTHRANRERHGDRLSRLHETGGAALTPEKAASSRRARQLVVAQHAREVTAWLTAHPFGSTFHYTPTSASWLQPGRGVFRHPRQNEVPSAAATSTQDRLARTSSRVHARLESQQGRAVHPELTLVPIGFTGAWVMSSRSSGVKEREELEAIVARPTEEAGSGAHGSSFSERGIAGREIALRLDLLPEHVSKVRPGFVPAGWWASASEIGTQGPRGGCADRGAQCSACDVAVIGRGAVGGRHDRAGQGAGSGRAGASRTSSGRTASSRTWCGPTRSVAIRTLSPRSTTSSGFTSIRLRRRGAERGRENVDPGARAHAAVLAAALGPCDAPHARLQAPRRARPVRRVGDRHGQRHPPRDREPHGCRLSRLHEAGGAALPTKRAARRARQLLVAQQAGGDGAAHGAPRPAATTTSASCSTRSRVFGILGKQSLSSSDFYSKTALREHLHAVHARLESQPHALRLDQARCRHHQVTPPNAEADLDGKAALSPRSAADLWVAGKLDHFSLEEEPPDGD